MSDTIAPPTVALPCRVRRSDGSVFDGALRPIDHQAIQLQILHQTTAGFIELTPGTANERGKAQIDRRKHQRHFLHGPARRPHDWLDRLLRHAARITAGDFQANWRPRLDPPRESVHVGVAGRNARRGQRENVEVSQFVWVDLDGPEHLDRLWALNEQYPAHLVVLSGGSGGVHAYWRLAEPLPATVIDPQTAGPVRDPHTGDIVEWIERANMRLIHRLGRDGAGEHVADWQCRDRHRVMRLAGTVNFKTGQYARILYADFHRPGYPIGDFIGRLADPPPKPKPPKRRLEDFYGGPDPYEAIPAVVYYEALTGREAGRGLVQCPHPDHPDSDPSCSLGSGDRSHLWKCHACDRAGGIYQMASAVLGGPTEGLRGEAFKTAQRLIVERFGDRRPPRPARPVERRPDHRPTVKETR